MDCLQNFAQNGESTVFPVVNHVQYLGGQGKVTRTLKESHGERLP